MPLQGVPLLRSREPTLIVGHLKGVANYYHVNLPSGEQVKDIVWWYRTPQPECGDIKGLVAFYDEKVDVFVDGVRQT